MMRDSEEREKVDMVVIAQIPDLQDDDEVLISALNWRLSLTAAGKLIPDLTGKSVPADFRLLYMDHNFNGYNRLSSVYY